MAGRGIGLDLAIGDLLDWGGRGSLDLTIGDLRGLADWGGRNWTAGRSNQITSEVARAVTIHQICRLRSVIATFYQTF